MPEVAWWKSLREEFPFLHDNTYVWWGGQSPLARTVRKRLDDLTGNWSSDPLSIERNEWPTFDAVRALAAEVMQCEPRRVVLSENTSHAMSIATSMVVDQIMKDPDHHSNIVLHWQSHSASTYAWLNAQRRGFPVELRWVEQDVRKGNTKSLLDAIDDQTAAVVITDVSYLTGELIELGPIFEARRRSRWALMIDAAQSAGAIPLTEHVQSADFIGFPAYKWLFGAPGLGFLIVSNEWLDRSTAPIAGWAAVKQTGVVEAGDYDPLDGGAGFRYGMPNFFAIAAGHEALLLAKTASQDRVAERIERLTASMLAGLNRLGYASPTPTDPRRRAGVVAVDVADANRVNDQLRADQIITIPERGRLRLDLHALNTEQDVDRILECLSRVPQELRTVRLT